MKFLGTKVPCTLEWPNTEGTWLYCDYIIWCVSCTVVVLTCFVICGCVYVWVLWQLYGCFGYMRTCIYCVLYYVYRVFLLFRLCTFILICIVCTSVRISATEWKLNCLSNNNNNNNKQYFFICRCKQLYLGSHSKLDNVHMNFFYHNDRYYHLPKCWPFLLNHPV